MASGGSSPMGRTRSSSTTSFASGESELDLLSDYGLHRALQKKNVKGLVTDKDRSYYRYLKGRREDLMDSVKNARIAFGGVWGKSVNAATANEVDLLNELNDELVNADRARVLAEREVETHVLHVNVLTALPNVTKHEMHAFMVRLSELTKENSEHAFDDPYVPLSAVRQLFDNVLRMKAELDKSKYDYTTLAVMRREEHHSHEDDFNSLVEAHFQLDDARGEIYQLRDELDHNTRLYDSLFNVYDAQGDADKYRQMTTLLASLGRTRAELKHLRAEKRQDEKIIKTLNNRMERLEDSETLIDNLRAEAKLFQEGIQDMREAAEKAQHKASGRAAEQQKAREKAEEAARNGASNYETAGESKPNRGGEKGKGVGNGGDGAETAEKTGEEHDGENGGVDIGGLNLDD